MIVGVHDNALKIKITAPPVEGKANAMCVKFLAKQLGVSKSMVAVTSGTTSKKKTITVCFEGDNAGRQELDRVKTELTRLFQK